MNNSPDDQDQRHPTSDLTSGSVISHYRIIRKIGGGGMGEIYLADDTKLERPVALKFLPEWLSQDNQARENLISEARAASKLNHPNIVSIHAIEETDDRVFIVMEHVEGKSLKELSGDRDLTSEKINDMARVKSAVEERNHSFAWQNGTGVSLSPKYFADSGAGGLQLQVTF